ncbi:hypothetical protein DL767_001410 [Monosporascus sp. MG133]|nr:hypothetical protein DL767_001410 [Monosporascus sp. MG133]
MPNAVAMIGITNPPGFARNLSPAFFGASASIGGYLGGLIVGGFLKSTSIVWIAMVSLAAAVLLWALLPCEVPVDCNGKIDWTGSFLSLGGLIVFNVVWNQAPAVGWSHPMIIAMLVASVGLFVGYGVWEHYFASDPIMPLSIKAPSFTPLIPVVLLNFMATGTLLWYTVAWLQEVRHWTPMRIAIGWTPFGVCGVAAAFLAALPVPRMPAQYILAIGATRILAANCHDAGATILLVSGFPEHRHQCLFPRSGLHGGPDHRQQFCQSEPTRHRGVTVGICVVALVLDLAFVRLVHDNCEGWADPADADPADEVAAPVATGAELQ